MKMQHSKTCYECSEIPGTDSYVSDHTTREHKLQCNKCGLKFAEESNLENHIVEGNRVICEGLNMTFGNDSHFEYHKYKHHESSLKPPAITAEDKKLRDEALTDSCMGQTQEGAMLEECKDDVGIFMWRHD